MVNKFKKRLLIVVAPLLMFATAVALGGGCKKSEASIAGGTSGAGGSATSDKKITIGFMYVGTKDDYGYNQAHADGAAEVKKLPGVTVKEIEGVKETKDCQQAMESMINQSGATLIFPTSFGYFNPHVLEISKKYPKITFLHAGGIYKDGMPENAGTYFAYIDELEYLCGMAAGYATKSGKLGYVAAKPITPVLRDINAFELGAKSVNPSATTTVIFTGDWFLPTKEADAVTSLADKGIDVITGHVDSPKVLIETAEKRQIFSCGYHYNGAKLSPQRYLTGAEWNWGPLYVKFVEDFKAGKLSPLPHNQMGNLHDGTVKLSDYGPALSPDARKAIDAVKAKMLAKEFKMFKGPIKDNTGKEVVPAGTEISDEDGALWGMNYFVEGVIGSVGG
jgi:simple sugar transport system substrate-binding protein